MTHPAEVETTVAPAKTRPYDVRSYTAGFAAGQAHGPDAALPAGINVPPPIPRMDYGRGFADAERIGRYETEAQAKQVAALFKKNAQLKSNFNAAIILLVVVIATVLLLIAISTWRS